MQEHRTAIEADLIRIGLRLRDVGNEGFTWNDLWALIDNPLPGTSFYTSYCKTSWTIQDALSAAMLDALNGIVWQNSGGKGPKPKPVERPQALRPKELKDTRKIRQGEPLDIGATRARLEARNGRR